MGDVAFFVVVGMKDSHVEVILVILESNSLTLL